MAKELDMGDVMDVTIIANMKRVLNDVEKRINDCLKSTNKDKEKGMPPNMDWRSEALGYKTSLQCIQRTRERFGLTNYSAKEKEEIK